MGHDIVGLTPDNFYPWVLKDADVLVINNFFQFQRPQFDAVLKEIWEKKKPYVVYSHDHREPYVRRDFAIRLFKESRLNVFISPRHRDNFMRLLGCDGIALPLAIDTDLFRPDPSVKREPDTALIVGGWVRGGKVSKRLRSFISANGKYTYLSVNLPVEGARHIPKRPLEKMPEVYSRAGALVHFPDIECSGERVVFEAALCGVKQFHLGDMVGHASWGFDLTDRDSLAKILRKAPIDFWGEVDRVRK